MPPEIELWYGHIKMATLWGLPMGETANIIGLAEIYERRGRRPWRGDNTTIIRDTFKAWPAEGQRRQIKNSLNGFEIRIMYSPWWSQLQWWYSFPTRHIFPHGRFFNVLRFLTRLPHGLEYLNVSLLFLFWFSGHWWSSCGHEPLKRG